MLNSLLNIISSLFILSIAVGSGLNLYRRMKLKASFPEELVVLSSGFGFLGLIYGTAVLAWVNCLNPMPMYFWLGFLSVAAIIGFQRWKTKRSDYESDKQTEDQDKEAGCIWWLWIGLGSIAFIYLLSSMSPPLDGDTLHSYLDVPRRYVHAGGIVPLRFEPLASQPLNMQMLSSMALIVRGDELAQMLVGATMAVGSASVVYLLGRQYFSMEFGLWAALLFLVTYVTGFLVPTTKANLGRAFFDLLGIYAVSRWAFEENHKDRWLLVAGIFTGVAFACQYPSGFVAVVMVLFISLATFSQEKTLSSGMKRFICRAFLYSLPVVLLSCPWLIKSYIETGNPVYPVLNQFFTGEDFLSVKQHSTNPWSIIKTMWDMSTGFIAWPYGKPIGPMFLALLPGALFLRPVPRQIRWAFITVGLLYVLWYLFGVQRPRHFLTGMGLLAVITAWILVTCKTRFPFVWRISVLGFILLFIFEAAFFVRLHFINYDKLKYVAGVISREQFLGKNLAKSRAYPHWDMVNYINNLPKDEAVVVSLYVGNDYYIDPDVVFFDSRMGDGSFFNSTPSNPQLILDEWHKLGVRYVFVNELYLKNINATDYDLVQSPAFQRECLKLVKKSGQQYLYRLTCDQIPKSVRR